MFALGALLIRLRRRGQEERFDYIDSEEVQILGNLFRTYKMLRSGLGTAEPNAAEERKEILLREITQAKSFKVGAPVEKLFQESNLFLMRRKDILVVSISQEWLLQLEETVLEELGESKLGARGTLGLAVLEEEKSREYDEEYESRG